MLEKKITQVIYWNKWDAVVILSDVNTLNFVINLMIYYTTL